MLGNFLIPTVFPNSKDYLKNVRRPIALWHSKIFYEPFIITYLNNRYGYQFITPAPRVDEKRHIDFYYTDTYGRVHTVDVKSVTSTRNSVTKQKSHSISMNKWTLASNTEYILTMYNYNIYIVSMQKMRDWQPNDVVNKIGVDRTSQDMYRYSMSVIESNYDTFIPVDRNLYNIYIQGLDIYNKFDEVEAEYIYDCRKNKIRTDSPKCLEWFNDRMNEYSRLIIDVIHSLNANFRYAS